MNEMDLIKFSYEEIKEVNEDIGNEVDEEDIAIINGRIIGLYEESENGKFWWIQNFCIDNRMLLTFDKKKVYDLYKDLHNMTREEVAIIYDEDSGYIEYYNKELARIYGEIDW